MSAWLHNTTTLVTTHMALTSKLVRAPKTPIAGPAST
jgi:hypothetical protein